MRFKPFLGLSAAVLLAGCTAPGQQSKAPETTPAETTSNSPTPTAEGTPEGLPIALVSRISGEEVGEFYFTQKEPVDCDGKPMWKFTFNITVYPGTHTAVTHSPANWNASSVETARCTPKEAQTASVQPGETVHGVEVVLDPAGHRVFTYEGGSIKPIHLYL